MRDRAGRKASGITFRVIVIALLLIVANSYWLMITSEMMSPPSYLTFVSLFFNAILSLFALVMVNKLLKWITPRYSFSPQELLAIYIMVVMASTTGGQILMGAYPSLKC